MRNKWFSYIRIDEKGKYILTSGITFKDFINGIDVKPANVLILNGYPSVCTYSSNLELDYVAQEQIEYLYQENVYDYGDFCWVDFQHIQELQVVSKEELAQLLYLAHKKEPYDKFIINSLNNRYAYLSHDDDFWVKIYMENPQSYMNVVEFKIMKELKGRKKYISCIPDKITGELYDMFKEGAIIDFEKSFNTSVRIYPIGKAENMDNIHCKLDKLRNQVHGMCLDYNPKTKQWSTY